MISFNVYRSPDVTLAWQAALHLIEDIISGKVTLIYTCLETAKSSIIHAHYSAIKTPLKAVSYKMSIWISNETGDEML
jgi:hypothetical protein